MLMNKTSQKSPMNNIIKVIICLAIPLAVGGISAALTSGAMSSFGDMKQPPLSPPGWLFPVAWTILYILMGIASYFIYFAGRDKKALKAASKTWLTIYGVQLFFNFCWSPVFFNFKWYWFALGWLLVMWAMIIVLIVKARKISVPAMWMLIPYLLWCTFAAYLNAGIAILN